jgi:hypothetical protein
MVPFCDELNDSAKPLTQSLNVNHHATGIVIVGPGQVDGAGCQAVGRQMLGDLPTYTGLPRSGIVMRQNNKRPRLARKKESGVCPKWLLSFRS